jgi:hypothetical protein
MAVPKIAQFAPNVSVISGPGYGTVSRHRRTVQVRNKNQRLLDATILFTADDIGLVNNSRGLAFNQDRPSPPLVFCQILQNLKVEN